MLYKDIKERAQYPLLGVLLAAISSLVLLLGGVLWDFANDNDVFHSALHMTVLDKIEDILHHVSWQFHLVAEEVQKVRYFD